MSMSPRRPNSLCDEAPTARRAGRLHQRLLSFVLPAVSHRSLVSPGTTQPIEMACLSSHNSTHDASVTVTIIASDGVVFEVPYNDLLYIP